MLQHIFRRVSNQAARIAHFVHNFITGIDAGGTADTFVLQAVADIDTDRAHLYAHGTVDAVAQIGFVPADVFLTRAARFAAFGIVRNNQCIGIEHRALEAGIRAHVFTHLLAHLMGEQPGNEAVKCRRKQRAAVRSHGKHRRYEFAYRCKPSGKGNPRPGAHGENQQIFGQFNADFTQAPRLFVQLQTFVAVAFDKMVYPQHDFGVHRLRAGVAAP